MNFGQAIEALKAGKKVAREGWNGKSMYLVLVVPYVDYSCDTVNIFSDIAKVCHKLQENSPCGNKYVKFDPYIIIRTAQKTAQAGWLASQSDMLTEDWIIIDD